MRGIGPPCLFRDISRDSLADYPGEELMTRPSPDATLSKTSRDIRRGHARIIGRNYKLKKMAVLKVNYLYS